MRMSELFGQTWRKAPSGVQSEGLALLMRGGFLRQTAAGVFSYLPLGRRVIGKIQRLIREELAGQEVALPLFLPADGPFVQGAEGKQPFSSGGDRRWVPTGKADELVAGLALSEIGSFRQLPRLIFQFKSNWIEKERPVPGPARFREHLMLYCYLLAAGEQELAVQYGQNRERLERVFARCDLPVKIADAEAADPEGALAHELVFLGPHGGETYLICDHCGYMANQEAAVFGRDPKSEESPRKLEKVATPEATTIRALTDTLKIPASRTAKAVFLMAGAAKAEREQFVVAVLRGDMELNEAKLAAALKAASLRPALEEEIRRWGIEPGYGSPVGVKGLRLVVDEAIPRCVNLVAGANEEGYHLLNVNYGRDYEGGVVADIAWAVEGAPCLRCGTPLRRARGTALAAGTSRDSGICERIGATFQDRDGTNKPVRLGLHSLDLGQFLVCSAECHHDEKGLVWPATIAPYDLYVVKLTRTEEIPLRVYHELSAAGVDVLYDDREESAGVKFNDADLIGVPIRLTIGERSLQAGGVELKLRGEGEKRLVSLDELVETVGALKDRSSPS